MMQLLRSIRFEGKAVAVCFLLVLFSSWCYARGYYPLTTISFFAALAIFVGVSFLGEKQHLFAAMIFAVPMSVGVTVFSGAELQFPTEPLIGLLLVMILISKDGMRQLANDVLASPLSKLLLAGLCWLIITSVTSQMPGVSFKYSFIRLCYVLIFFFLGLQWMRYTGKPQQLFLCYAIGMLLPIIHGMIFHAEFGFSHQTAYQMPKPFFNDHTVYGACIAFIIPMIGCCIIGWRSFGYSVEKTFLLVGLLVFFMAALFLSYSRAAWLSMICAAALGILLWIRIRPWQLLALLLLMSGTLYFQKENILAGFEEKKAVSSKGGIEEHVKSITNIETDASNKERINRWKCALRMGNEKPLFGFGPRTYKFLYGQYQLREDMTWTSTFNGNKGHAHSEYLAAYAEQGIPGFILQCLLFLGTLLYGTGVARNCVVPENRLIAIGALLGFFTYFVHGIFNSFTEDDKMASLVFISMATLVYIKEAERREMGKAGELKAGNVGKEQPESQAINL